MVYEYNGQEIVAELRVGIYDGDVRTTAREEEEARAYYLERSRSKLPCN